MRVLSGIAITLILLLTVGLVVVYGGTYNVAADAGHTAFGRWLLDTTMQRSVAVRADDIVVPPLDRPEVIARGAREYDEMCVICHLKPGQSPTPLHQGLTPRPPDFSRHGTRMTTAENFWIIKHGVKMTGMPAWGETHNDEELWALAAFVERLPDLSAQEYEKLAGSGDMHDMHGKHEEHGGHRH